MINEAVMQFAADLFTGTEFGPPGMPELDAPGFGDKRQAGYAALRNRAADAERFYVTEGGVTLVTPTMLRAATRGG